MTIDQLIAELQKKKEEGVSGDTIIKYKTKSANFEQPCTVRFQEFYNFDNFVEVSAWS